MGKKQGHDETVSPSSDKQHVNGHAFSSDEDLALIQLDRWQMAKENM